MKSNLPIVPIFMEALSFPYRHHRKLLKVGFPLIITGGLHLVFVQSQVDAEGNMELSMLGILLAAALALSLLIAVVGCHRIFLMDDGDDKESSLLNWTGNEIKYVGWWILIGICAALLAIPFWLIVMPFLMSFSGLDVGNSYFLIVTVSIASIPIYYLVSRWSLVLPSSAIGIHGKSLTWSWELSSGNGWRLTLLIGILPFVSDILFDMLFSHDSLVLVMFQGALWLVIGVIEIGLLSLSYKFLVSKEVSASSYE